MKHLYFSYALAKAFALLLLGLGSQGLLGQCGVTIPNGERCEAPGGSNCEFYICVQGSCVPSGIFYPAGTKCGCFTDECFEDFCDGMGTCTCGIFEASAGVKCASEQNICDGVNQCDGVSGEFCNGPISFPAAACDDGVMCTEDCNPVTGCVTYPIDQYCDDGDICSTDVCDTTQNPGCIYFCSGASGCANSSFCTSFPVTWLNFSAHVERNLLKLEWMTAQEKNNRGFEVEMSTDGLIFKKLGFVRGAGNSQDAQFYDFHSRIGHYGTHYVRLKQVDVNGNFSYSPTLDVRIPKEVIVRSLRSYPNPFRTRTSLEFVVEENVPVSIVMYDQHGQEISVIFKGMAQANEVYKVPIDAGTLSPGTYFCELVGPLERKVCKLLVY
jgi:hypothetical protein